MKPLKLSFALILIGSTLLLNEGSKAVEPPNQKEAKPQSKKTELDKKEPTQQRTPADLVPPKPPTDKYHPDKQASEKKNQPWQPADWFNLWLVIFTGCLVGVGIAQVFVYRRQAKYMRRGLRLTQKAAEAAEKSANIADKSLKTLERAQVLVMFSYQFRPGSPEFSYEVKNIGRTLAKVKQTDFGCAAGPTLPDYQIKPKPVGDLPTKFIVYPNIPVSLRNRVDIQLPPEKAGRVERGEEIFEVRGFIIYDDIFDVRHVTRFRQIYHPSENNGHGGFVFSTDIKPEYNEAD